ncbi:hypothetical protein NECAME_11250 [Necator americanus]|uniref:Uncharacterized protein n=1 Tax=Necator americanus TaxID=51031 RepID=W2T810_NECAM|nr:hypothetical protein NECAME_11250 [Necator americanus]ETN77137.1 hypothetical protein NECAME_11250 [Necator americanus]
MNKEAVQHERGPRNSSLRRQNMLLEHPRLTLSVSSFFTPWKFSPSAILWKFFLPSFSVRSELIQLPTLTHSSLIGVFLFSLRVFFRFFLLTFFLTQLSSLPIRHILKTQLRRIFEIFLNVAV